MKFEKNKNDNATFEQRKNENIEEICAELTNGVTPQEAKEKKTLRVVLIAGFFCPPMWLIYFLSKNWSSVKKVAKPLVKSAINGFVNASSNQPTGKPSECSESEAGKKFLITGGDGNVYESGGLFCDWAGNHLTWGSPFRDSRGNLVAWGSPFYDNRGYYITWGQPFYDAGDNYVNPRG